MELSPRASIHQCREQEDLEESLGDIGLTRETTGIFIRVNVRLLAHFHPFGMI